MSRHPIQPVEKDHEGFLRFKQNKIIRDLLDFGQAHGFGLNEIAAKGYSAEDRQQLAQLIGYSLGGYSELSYVNDDAFDAAEKMAYLGLTEDKAKIASLEEELEAVKSGLRKPMARLFGVHPDDLKG